MTENFRLQSFGRSCHIVISHENDAPLEQLVRDELRRVEDKFSYYLESSIVGQLNAAAGQDTFIPLDEEARSLFEYVATLWQQSNHQFDPTSRVLLDCYSGEGKLRASPSQLTAMLALVGWPKLQLTPDGARLTRDGMQIDLNSIVCAYAADSVRKKLKRAGVSSALIDLDNEVATIGRQADGANWLVGVRHPAAGGRQAFARLKVNDSGFSRRGNYERRNSWDGEEFSRALSPVDGQPVPGLLSVQVVAENCLTAFSAATIAWLKAEPQAIHWLDNLGMRWMAVDRKFNCLGPLAPA